MYAKNQTIGNDSYDGITVEPVINVNENVTEDHLIVENYDDSVRVAFMVVNTPFIVFSVLALVALNRTRKTPCTAR